jgi:hypothetical protein
MSYDYGDWGSGAATSTATGIARRIRNLLNDAYPGALGEDNWIADIPTSDMPDPKFGLFALATAQGILDALKGEQREYVRKFEYDFAVDGDSGASVLRHAKSDTLGYSGEDSNFIPDNAIITKAYYDVLEELVGGAATTIRIYVLADGDLMPVTPLDPAAGGAGLPGLHMCSTGFSQDFDSDAAGTGAVDRARSGQDVADDAASSLIKTTQNRVVVLATYGPNLTEGRMNLFVHYVISE